jgi:hypothetical protein
MTKFHLGDLLSISDGRLLSPEHIGGVYKILNHMTGDNLMTHQLPLACDAMLPELLTQHPWLKDVDPVPHVWQLICDRLCAAGFLPRFAEVYP